MVSIDRWFLRGTAFLRGQAKEIKRQANYSFLISKSLSTFTLSIVATAYIAASLVEKHLAGFAFDTTPLRLLVASSLIPFMLRDRWPNYLIKLGPLISSLTAGIIFPFCFGTILFVNAALSESYSGINSFAVTEYVLSTFFLVQVLFHTRLILVVWAFSTLAVALVVLCITNANLSLVWDHCLYIFPFFATTLLVGGIINQNLFNFQKQRELAVWNVANSIAHQLRTPLATIRNISSGSKNHMTDLAAGYYSGVRNGLIEAPLSNRKIDALEHSFESILNEVKHSGALIDILIANSKPFEQLEAPQNYIAIANVVTTAVEDYPYNNPTEHNLIDLDVSNDFQVNALENMILHVMFNLIANAVEFCQKRPDGRIKIWLETGEQWNKVHVWDSGNGIPKKYLHEVFDPFFSRNSPNGTGIGLSFCKSVMEGIGGKIYCASVEGQFCQFTLSFPSTAN